MFVRHIDRTLSKEVRHACIHTVCLRQREGGAFGGQHRRVFRETPLRFDLVCAFFQNDFSVRARFIDQEQFHVGIPDFFEFHTVAVDLCLCRAVDLIELEVRRLGVFVRDRLIVLIQYIQRHKLYRFLLADAGKLGQGHVASPRPLLIDFAIMEGVFVVFLGSQRRRDGVGLFDGEGGGGNGIGQVGSNRRTLGQDLKCAGDWRVRGRSARHGDCVIARVFHARYRRGGWHFEIDGIIFRLGVFIHRIPELVDEVIHGEGDCLCGFAGRNFDDVADGVGSVRQGEDGLAGFGIVALDLEGTPITILRFPVDGGTCAYFAPDVCLQVPADQQRAVRYCDALNGIARCDLVAGAIFIRIQMPFCRRCILALAQGYAILVKCTGIE